MSEVNDFIIKDGELKSYKGKSCVIDIPEEVTSIGYGAFANCPQIIAVNIPDSVTRIGEYAFFGCKNLKLITIPSGITGIGGRAFLDCSSLRSIAIPASVESIGKEAFRLCRGLADQDGFVIVKDVLYDYYGKDKDVKIPESVTQIDAYAFFNYRDMVSLTIPGNIKAIDKDAFKVCTGLKKINLPENIEVFEESVIEVLWEFFRKSEHRISIMYSMLKQYPYFVVNNTDISKKIKANKKNLFALALENGSAEILDVLFSLFKKIEIDELNDYIEAASSSELRSSTSIKAFLINYKAENYTVQMQEKYENDSVEKAIGLKKRSLSDWKKIYSFKTNGENVTITGYKGKDIDVLIPDKIGKYKVDAIDIGAFSPVFPGVRKEIREMRENIRSVFIPDSVTTICRGAFCGCKNLTSIILPQGITSISWGEFGDCAKLSEVIIPSSVTKIEGLAFSKCISLKSITIPDKVDYIGDKAFYDCENLSSITFPNRKIRIVEDAFKNCESLVDKNGFVAVQGVLYNYYGSESNITIPAKTKIIKSYTFKSCKNIKSVIIPDSVESIEYGAFYDCENLTSIRIPKNIRSIGDNVFGRCKNLEKIVITNSLTILSENAFVGCPKLTIHARAGSKAEKYAKENHIPFVRK